jgi:hypothetical protein
MNGASVNFRSPAESNLVIEVMIREIDVTPVTCSSSFSAGEAGRALRNLLQQWLDARRFCSTPLGA